MIAVKIPAKARPKHEGRTGDGVITLWIDSYSDIFSDFDPRPFSERAISDDFISQVKRVSRETADKVEILKLLVPEGTQKEEHERIIKKRLQSYFYNFCTQLRMEIRKIRNRGLVFTFLGVGLMIAASYIVFLNLSSFSYKLILTLCEPGGWFLFWTGLDLIISISWNKQTELLFYTRMENVHVEFSSYK